MRNTRLDEVPAGIKIAGRNINHLRYADDTTLMIESGVEIKSLLMKVKEQNEKSWLKTQHSENKDHSILLHHFVANGETMETVTDFVFFCSKITAGGDCRHEMKNHLLLGKKA